MPGGKRPSATLNAIRVAKLSEPGRYTDGSEAFLGPVVRDRVRIRAAPVAMRVRFGVRSDSGRTEWRLSDSASDSG